MSKVIARIEVYVYIYTLSYAMAKIVQRVSSKTPKIAARRYEEKRQKAEKLSTPDTIVCPLNFPRTLPYAC